MPEYIEGYRANIIWRYIIPAVQPRNGAGAAVQGNSASRTGAESRPTCELRIQGARVSCCQNQGQQILLNRLGHEDIRNFRPGFKHLVGSQANISGRLTLAVITSGQVENGLFGLCRRVTNHHMHQKAVKLGFGKWVGTFLLNRVLGCHHHEQAIKRKCAHAHTDLALAHGLKQGRLYFGWCPIDFIRQHQVVKNRPTLKLEQPGFGTVDLAAGDV